MDTNHSFEPDDNKLEDNIQEIIQASTDHNLQTLEICINQYSFPDCKAVDVQDHSTGFSPLHAAISSCKASADETGSEALRSEETGAETLQFLLENGAIWNQLDRNDETPGCLAFRLGLHSMYQIMVDAGVRAEMLLSRLEEYLRLDDEEEDGEVNGDESRETVTEADAAAGSNLREDVTSSAYLSSALSLTKDKLLDEQQNGVMMAWESDIMLQSADCLLFEPGLRVLNIGFGLGIIDAHIQAHSNKPASHHIVEAHPDVLSNMRQKGWMEKTNVVVHSGKWQDVLPNLVAEGEVFDAIFFDTFAESYSDFREFFSEQVIELLNENGRWSYFNGMGADRRISYDVYQKVVELDLFESGFDVEWKNVQLPNLGPEWEGVRRKYWNVDSYRLPICRFMV